MVITNRFYNKTFFLNVSKRDYIYLYTDSSNETNCINYSINAIQARSF